MKVWKLVSGIISIVSFLIIILQSCATGMVNSMEDNDADSSGEAGVYLGFFLLVAGCVSVASWRAKSRGADIAVVCIAGIASAIGFANLGTYGDLEVWSYWCAICAGMALISACLPHKKEESLATKED